MCKLLSVITLLSVAALISGNLPEEWSKFKERHEKIYESRSEELERFRIFTSNLRKIEEHNKLYNEKLATYKLGVNKFADWTKEEFLGYLNLHGKGKGETTGRKFIRPSKEVVLPETVNWNKTGAVTNVKDQRKCGSCWAFSATGALEGQNYLVTGKLISLSEQELIDCSQEGGNQGCYGGLMDDAFQYVIKNGLSTEEDYPYEAVNNFFCDRGSLRSVVAETNYTSIDTDESALKEAVATVGPISVAVDASNWHLYEGGVFLDSECRSDELNHGVLAVGYGTTDDGDEYWLIKNSWGLNWGENGYIRTARNKNNNCGVATLASFPVL